MIGSKILRKIMNLIGVSSEKSKMPMAPETKMYVILREDLSMKYISGTHAVVQFGLEHPNEFKEWNNGKIVCLSVFNGLALSYIHTQIADAVVKYLLEKNIKVNNYDDYSSETPYRYSVFVEPDLQSPLPTAIAFYNNCGQGEILKHLSLATK